MQPLIAKWQRMTKRSGSYDNVSRRISCLLQQHKLAPVLCIGASSAEEGLGTGTQRRHDRQVLRGNLETEMQLSKLQYRRGLLQLSVPRSLVLQPDFAAGSVRDEAS